MGTGTDSIFFLFQAIALLSGAGEISVLSIHTLGNLLSGGSVTGWSITPATNEQFFLLKVLKNTIAIV